LANCPVIPTRRIIPNARSRTPILSGLGREWRAVRRDRRGYGNPDPAQGENSPGFQAALRALGTGRGRVKVSGTYRTPGCEHPASAACLLREAGAEKLLFGSDWPFVGHDKR
jgi:hypothetical protein